MVRAIAIAGILALVAALALLVADPGGNAVPAVLLLLLSFGITALLAARRLLIRARSVVSDARAFFSGDVQRARLVEVGEPEGIFGTHSTAVFELEAEDGTTRRFEHEVPVPFFTAWGYRLAKRLPFATPDPLKLVRLMAFELKREGLRFSVGLGGGDAAGAPADAT
jgi:hypothetical protein